jgi:uncharacterized OB-fold protein
MQPLKDDDFFWEGVDQGELLVQACENCNTLRHPPAPMCGTCQSVHWSPSKLSGHGTVYTWLVSKHPTEPDRDPRTVVLIDLEEGLRFVSNLVDGEDVEVGAKVELTFGEVKGVRLPLFKKAQEA